MASITIPIETPETDASLALILNGMELIMKTLTDLKSDVAAQRTVIDSILALVSGFAAQVAALKPNQEDIDKLALDIEAQTKDLADAVTANTQS